MKKQSIFLSAALVLAMIFTMAVPTVFADGLGGHDGLIGIESGNISDGATGDMVTGDNLGDDLTGGPADGQGGDPADNPADDQSGGPAVDDVTTDSDLTDGDATTDGSSGTFGTIKAMGDVGAADESGAGLTAAELKNLAQSKINEYEGLAAALNTAKQDLATANAALATAIEAFDIANKAYEDQLALTDYEALLDAYENLKEDYANGAAGVTYEDLAASYGAAKAAYDAVQTYYDAAQAAFGAAMTARDAADEAWMAANDILDKMTSLFGEIVGLIADYDAAAAKEADAAYADELADYWLAMKDYSNALAKYVKNSALEIAKYNKAIKAYEHEMEIWNAKKAAYQAYLDADIQYKNYEDGKNSSDNVTEPSWFKNAGVKYTLKKDIVFSNGAAVLTSSGKIDDNQGNRSGEYQVGDNSRTKLNNALPNGVSVGIGDFTQSKIVFTVSGNATPGYLDIWQLGQNDGLQLVRILIIPGQNVTLPKLDSGNGGTAAIVLGGFTPAAGKPDAVCKPGPKPKKPACVELSPFDKKLPVKPGYVPEWEQISPPNVFDPNLDESGAIGELRWLDKLSGLPEKPDSGNKTVNNNKSNTGNKSNNSKPGAIEPIAGVNLDAPDSTPAAIDIVPDEIPLGAPVFEDVEDEPVIEPDDAAPEAPAPEKADDEITIEPNPVPLARMPQTGVNDSLIFWVLGLIGSILLVFCSAYAIRRRNRASINGR